MSHTKGKWEVVDSPGFISIIAETKIGLKEDICFIPISVSERSLEREANAQLIAEAPVKAEEHAKMFDVVTMLNDAYDTIGCEVDIEDPNNCIEFCKYVLSLKDECQQLLAKIKGE